MAKISLGFAESFCLGSNYVGPIIWTRGTDAQCRKYLPPTIQGKWMGAYALTEQSGGSDPGTRKTSAVRKKDKWIVNGSNIFITNRIPHAARALGCAEGAFALALPYAKERVVWGQPLIKHQSLTFKFAEMATQIETARLMVDKAAWLFDRKDHEWSRFAAMAKLTAAEVNRRVARDCMEVFGCYGLMSEHRAQRYFRDSQYLPIIEGSHEILKIVISQPWTR